MGDDTVVCDTGPLIALATLDRLDLLEKLFGRVVVPRAVLSEIQRGGPDQPGSNEIARASWLEIVHGNEPEPLLAAELGAGEAAAIATARSMTATVLLDEKRARRIAEKVYGLPVRGTLGALLMAKRRGFVPALRPLVEQLLDSGYYISKRVVAGVLVAAGEQ